MTSRKGLLPCRRSGDVKRYLTMLVICSSAVTGVLYVTWSSSNVATVTHPEFGNIPRASKFRFRSRSELFLQTGNSTQNLNSKTNVSRVIAEWQRLANEYRQWMREPPAMDEAFERSSSNSDTTQSIKNMKPFDERSKHGVGRRQHRLGSAAVKMKEFSEDQTSVSRNNSRINKQANKTELGVGNDGTAQSARQSANAEDTDNRRPAVEQSVSYPPTTVRILQGPVNRVGLIYGGPGKCRVYNVQKDPSQVSGADFPPSECITINIRNIIGRSKSADLRTAFVCPYRDEVDVHLSKPLREHGIWEPHIVQVFVAAVSWVVKATGAGNGGRSATSRAIGVYDIGANIGQYSAIASTVLNCSVVAVEPYRPSIYRLHRATHLNGAAEKTVVLENAMSDVRDTFELSVVNGNPSGVALTTQDADRYCDELDCPAHATTIVMDDLLEVTNFDVAVMKIDIEGYEHRAFAHSDQLLREVEVVYIFMEWTKMRDYYGSEADISEDKRMVQQLIDRLAIDYEYKVYGMNDMQQLDPRFWYGWPNDIVWVHKEAIPPDKLLSINER